MAPEITYFCKELLPYLGQLAMKITMLFPKSL